MGLVAGRLADVSSRKTVIFFGVVIWNLAMVGLGMSNVFWQLLLWRLVLGVGQAFTNPASYSLIADYFPEEKRAQANGLFACGVYVGGGVASLCIEVRRRAARRRCSARRETGQPSPTAAGAVRERKRERD